MINDIKEFWNDKGYEIIFWGSLIVIIYFIINSLGKSCGTWDKRAYDKYKSLIIPTEKPYIVNRGSESKGEIRCREFLQNRFGLPFNKIRPYFLRNQVTSSNTKNINLELDCYNEQLKLAVEYNGQQHYKFNPYFHRNIETFHNQKYRDEIKKYKCRENGIVLIEVPYTEKDIELYLENELQKYGY